MARLEIEFLDVAKADFREAIEWHQQHTGSRVTRKFALSLAKALDQIALFPKACPVFRGSVRRIALRVFVIGFITWKPGVVSKSERSSTRRPIPAHIPRGSVRFRFISGWPARTS